MSEKKQTRNERGPYQIVHDFKFTALNVKDDYSFLDTLDHNGKLEYIKTRLDRLHRLGYGGVVMNVDYKNYLKDPEAFRLFFASAEYAKELGLGVWIYDEQYYPSGGAGGLTLVGHPEFEAVCLACVSKDVKVDSTVGAVRVPSPLGYSELKYAFAAPIRNGEVQNGERIVILDKKDLAGGLCFDAPTGEWRVWCFFARPLYELTKFCKGTRASRRYISIFNKKAVEHFYKVTFEDGYKSYTDSPLSAVADAVFTDEPYSPFYKNYVRSADAKRTAMPSCSVYDEPQDGILIYPYIPWEMSLPDRYFERYGKRIEDTLPDIFEDTPLTKEARVDFYSLLSDISKEAFAEQMSEKLGKEGVRLSGHYYGEEGFDFQPIFHGDIIDHLGVMAIPGCDCLWSDLDVLRYSVACKLASSAAHLNLRSDVMIEASNMIDKDQNITLERAKAAVSTMFSHGVTFVTSYYGENMLPDEEMAEFAEHISSLSRLFKDGRYRVNTLLYYPFENLCANRYPMGIVEGNDNGEDSLKIASTAAKLIGRQVCFDFINKKKLLSLKMSEDALVSPGGDRIEYIVFPDLPWIDGEVAEFISRAEKRGVKVIFDGEKRGICNLGFTKNYLNDGVYPVSALSLKEENNKILAMHHSHPEYDIFMLANTDAERHTADVTVDRAEGCDFVILDHVSMEETTAEYKTVGSKAHISLDIPAFSTVIIKKVVK